MKKDLVKVIYDDRKGRCVIALKDIRKGTVVMRDHVILAKDTKHLKKTIFTRYVFEWDRNTVALPLGMASLINHSRMWANMQWMPLFECQMVEMVATSSIKKGEELVFDYGNTDGFKAVSPIRCE